MTEYRHVPDAGNLVDGLGHAIIDEAGDREALTLVKIHFRFGLSSGDCGNQKSLNGERVGIIQRADFRLHFGMDQSVRVHGRREEQTNAERTELNRHDRSRLRAAAGGGDHWEWELSARKKTRLTPADGHE